MGSIDRYIFRTTLASFALVLVSLTGVIWITQALRGIDLMTSQGQTIITFLGITGLVIPALVLIIAPIALVDLWLIMYDTRQPLGLKPSDLQQLAPPCGPELEIWTLECSQESDRRGEWGAKLVRDRGQQIVLQPVEST